MKPKVIAVAAQKGGVGKSCLAWGIASFLCEEARTLVIDLDPQRTLSNAIAQSFEKTSFDVLTHRTSLQEAIAPAVASFGENLFCVPASQQLAGIELATLWLNLGDSYAGSGKVRNSDGSHSSGQKQNTNQGSVAGSLFKATAYGKLKPKDLVGIPWRVAFALQSDGWILRSDIIWHKPNPMPESVKDRPTKAHEYIFLLSKGEKYFYDADAVREPCVTKSNIRTKCEEKHNQAVLSPIGKGTREWNHPLSRNRRTVWTLPTKPFKGAHFATFPPDLVEPCILAGCPKGGVVLDPFVGSGTTLLVAKQHGRSGIGIELNPDFVKIAQARLGTSDE